jgi:hypothetical protein
VTSPVIYRGRSFTETELALIRQLIAAHPHHCRAELSRRLCQALAWFSPGGRLKEMSARVAMLQMERDGLITLPKARQRHGNHCRYQVQTGEDEPPPPMPVVSADQWEDLRLEPVVKATSRRWNDAIARYHYLGYRKLPGAQLRYFACSGDQVLALMGFSAAAWKVAPRDTFIGWPHPVRQRNLHRVIQNSRFLILPWIRSPNLASCLLAMARRVLPRHWEQRYGYRPVLIETFVELGRFQGTCYRADNWLYLGNTKGRGRYDRHTRAELPPKAIFVVPLTADFRRVLNAVSSEPPATRIA